MNNEPADTPCVAYIRFLADCASKSSDCAMDTGNASEAARIARQAVEYASQASSRLDLTLRTSGLSNGDAVRASGMVEDAWQSARKATEAAHRAAGESFRRFRASAS